MSLQVGVEATTGLALDGRDISKVGEEVEKRWGNEGRREARKRRGGDGWWRRGGGMRDRGRPGREEVGTVGGEEVEGGRK